MTRLRAAVALELTVEWRYRIPVVALVVTAVWTLVLLMLPTPVARAAGPFVLTIDTATFGALFIAALVLFERGEGALAALTVSPLRFGEYLGAKIVVLTGLSVASAVPVALAAHLDLAGAVAGVGLLAVLFLVLGVALVAGHRSLTGFLTTAPAVLAPLIAAPLVHLTGVVDHPLLSAIPTTGAADIVRGVVHPAAIGYLVLVVATAAWLAARTFARATEDRVVTKRARRRRVEWRPRGWLRTLAGIDRRTSVRSALLVVVLAGPVLLAVVLRLGHPPLVRYLDDRFGFDLVPYQPVLLAALVVLHVPLIIGMVGALLVLDDLDDGVLLVLRVSPLTTARYLAYRVVAVAAVAALMLVVTVPLSGLAERLPPAATTLAAAQAPLVLLATVAMARNKVEGLVWLKILGLLPTGVAPAVWWLPDAVHRLLWIMPHYWTVDVLWHPTPSSLLAGAAVTALATSLLAGRALRRLGGTGA